MRTECCLHELILSSLHPKMMSPQPLKSPSLCRDDYTSVTNTSLLFTMPPHLLRQLLLFQRMHLCLCLRGDQWKQWP